MILSALRLRCRVSTSSPSEVRRSEQASTIEQATRAVKEGRRAADLGISVATVGRELRIGQAWLRRELTPSSG